MIFFAFQFSFWEQVQVHPFRVQGKIYRFGQFLYYLNHLHRNLHYPFFITLVFLVFVDGPILLIFFIQPLVFAVLLFFNVLFFAVLFGIRSEKIFDCLCWLLVVPLLNYFLLFFSRFGLLCTVWLGYLYRLFIFSFVIIFLLRIFEFIDI